MTLSAPALAAAFAQETGEAYLFILEISHPSLSEPIRITNNHEAVVSNGNTYTPLNFEIDIPDQGEDVPNVTVKIDNVDRVIVDNIRAINSPPTFSLSVVLSSTPDIIEAGPFEMRLSDVEYDAFVVSGRLMFEDILTEPYPAGSFNPPSFPGLF